jgi:hypothetical protein
MKGETEVAIVSIKEVRLRKNLILTTHLNTHLLYHIHSKSHFFLLSFTHFHINMSNFSFTYIAPGDEMEIDGNEFLCNWHISEPLGSPLMPNQPLAQPNFHPATAVPANVPLDSFPMESSNCECTMFS